MLVILRIGYSSYQLTRSFTHDTDAAAMALFRHTWKETHTNL